MRNIPKVQVDGADVRDQLLRLEVKLAEVLDLQGTHLGPHEMLQEVVEHRDDPLRQEWVHKDAFDLCTRMPQHRSESQCGEKSVVPT